MKNNNKDDNLILGKIFQLEKDKSLLLDFILEQYSSVIKQNPRFQSINSNNKESVNVAELLEYLKKKSSPTIVNSTSSFPSPSTSNISPITPNSSTDNLQTSPNNNITTPHINTNNNSNPTSLPNDYSILSKEQFHYASFECYLLLTHFSKPELINAETEELFRVQMEIPKAKYQGFIKLLSPNHISKHPLFTSLTYRLWLLKYFDFKLFDNYDSLMIWFRRQLYFILAGIINQLRDPFDDKDNKQIIDLKLCAYHLEKLMEDGKPSSVIDDQYQTKFRALDLMIGQILTKNSVHLSKQVILATEYLNEPIFHQFPLNTLIFEDLLFYNLFEFKEDEIVFVGDEHLRVSPSLKPLSTPLKITPTMEKISHLNCFVIAYQAEPTNEHFKRLLSSLDSIQQLIESNIQLVQDPSANTANLLKLTLKKIATWLIKLLSDVHSYKGENPAMAIDIACTIYSKSREMWGLLSSNKQTIRTTESNFSSFISASVSYHYQRASKAFRPMTLDNFSDFIDLLTPEIKSNLTYFTKGFQKHHSQCQVVALNEFVNLYSSDLKVVFADVYFLSPAVLKSVQTASAFQLFLEELNLIPYDKLPPVKDYVSSVIISWCQNQEKYFNKWFENSFKLDKFLPLDKDVKHSSSVIDMFQMFYQTISTLGKMRGSLSDNFPNFICTLSSMFNNCLIVYNSSIADITNCNQKNQLYPLSINERIHKKGKVRRSLSLSNPIIQSTLNSSSSSSSSSSSLNNQQQQQKEKENNYSQLTPFLQTRLQSTSLLTLCVCLNNLDFILKHLHDYIEQHSYNNESLKVKLIELFQPVQIQIKNTCKQLIDFIGCRVVFFDCKSTILDQTYLAPLIDNTDRIQFSLDSLNPHLKTIYGNVQSIDRSNEILTSVCKSFVQAYQWILLYSGPNRMYQPKDASMIEYDIELVKDFFLDRDEQGNANGVPDKTFDAIIQGTLKVVNLLMELASEVLIEQFNNNTSPNSRNMFHNDIILSVLIHRADKPAKNFIKKKEQDPSFHSIKKGSKINLNL
ncbi:hypothetical protein DLAC_04310 [Tieghemostelium lacteum]|uniref:Uncharacterized protein n=1 Tax=Tieghemostelium lacteum TaxID=361077 RepID=A0A151ZJA1_TIELA|nr:hypothetical protein DLAC_04310 [Tieghemostelium lacteum]|eukprot:KYQ94036.1 hypothetical protein DLAC_04310 [Tieghemostelium lacteum]